MRITYPVKLDAPVQLGTSGLRVERLEHADLARDVDFLDAYGNRVTVSGYDSSNENNGKGARVTNLCGIRGGDLLKQCSRGECRRVLPQDAFGPEGRVTPDFRDQSNCPECRRNYGR